MSEVVQLFGQPNQTNQSSRQIKIGPDDGTKWEAKHPLWKCLKHRNINLPTKQVRLSC